MKRIFALLLTFLAIISPTSLLGCTSHIELLEYELNEEGTEYCLSKYNYLADEATNEVAIPSTYNDLPVTKIGAGAFRSCSEITKVTIPDSITHIESGAFRWCYNLVEIEIPTSITFIGEGAFEDCSKLESTLSFASNCCIKSSAFSGCKALTTIEFGTTDEVGGKIGAYAFYECDGLKNVVISKGCEVIEDRAFSDCGMLKTLTLTNQLIDIGSSAFENCLNLETINFIGTETEWKLLHKQPWWDLRTGSYTINYINE